MVGWVGEGSWPCAPKGKRRMTLGAAISCLCQHDSRGPAVRCHRGNGKAGETLRMRLRQGTVPRLILRAGVETMIIEGCSCCRTI